MKKFFKKICKYICSPVLVLTRYRIRKLHKRVDRFDDKTFLEKKYQIIFHEKLNLDKPRSFNEKIQWLKLYDRNPLYVSLVDKIKVRDYVSKIIGDEYLIPLIGVYDSPFDIDFQSLPNAFVLKCNHDSGSTFVCQNKDSLSKSDFNAILNNLEKHLSIDYSIYTKEWPYHDVKRKILCEELLPMEKVSDGDDYKFFCCDGKFKFLLVCSDRFTNLSNNWYDESFKILHCSNGPKKNKERDIVLPEEVFYMASLAEKLSKNIPFVRVDFYFCNNHIYFSELTFYESSGFSPFKPKKYNMIFGDYIKLPEAFDKRD